MDRYATLRNGLVGAWCPSLGDSGYTLRDRSSSLKNAMLLNMGGQVAFQADNGGIGLVMDGSNDYALSDALPLAVIGFPITLSAWARPNNVTQTTVICVVGDDSPNGSRRLVLQRNGLLEANGNFSDVATVSSVFTANTWTHVACVWPTGSLSDVRLYANGVQFAGTIVQSQPLVNLSSTKSAIGATILGVAPYNGRIDDVRIYSRALPQSEIRMLASRRGIGLLPTRHRRASVLSQFWAKVAGTWKTAQPWINVSGTWKKAAPKLRAGSAWKG